MRHCIFICAKRSFKDPTHHLKLLGRLVCAMLPLVFLVAASAPSAAEGAGNFEKEWAKLIANAKKEGRVVIAAGGQPSRNYRPVMEVFEKRFGIPVEMSSGSARVTVNRVLAERRAHTFTVDVGLIAHNSAQRRLVPAKALMPIAKMFIHPEVTNKAYWHGNRYWYADRTQKYVFLYTAKPDDSWHVWYNTEKINKKEIATIKTLADFLKPKWWDRMAVLDIRDPSGLANFIHLYLAPDAGPSWVKKFIQQANVTYVADRRVLELWLTKGHYPVQFPPSSEDKLIELAEAGQPIKYISIPKKLPGLLLGGSACCIEAFDRPAHPNAAKLFINWFLSKEGQQQVNNIEGFLIASLREDIGWGKTQPSAHRQRGITYRFGEAEPWHAKAANAAVKKIQKWWKSRPNRQ